MQVLELLNLGHMVTTVFPIQSLRSKDLRIFRIGFLTLHLYLFCFNYNSLQILDFFCCSLDSIKLSWVVTDCLSLRELRVQYCCVDLHINSNSLKFLYSIGNTGNRIVIASAPNLLSLIAGMVPKQQSSLDRQRIQAWGGSLYNEISCGQLASIYQLVLSGCRITSNISHSSKISEKSSNNSKWQN